MNTYLEARKEARRLAKSNNVSMAVVKTMDENTGYVVYEYCPVRAFETLYGPLARIRKAMILESHTQFGKELPAPGL